MTRCGPNGEPIFNNPDLIQVNQLRELIRVHVPRSRDGFCEEDLDLVMRRFIPTVDEIGRLRLVEVKYRDAPLGASKEMTFGLMDQLMRAGDPTGSRYVGFYVVRHGDDNWNERTVIKINGASVSLQEFLAWCRWEREDIQPYGFPAFRRWSARAAVLP